MAATTSNVNPRRTGFDFAALAASAGRQDGGEEVVRLRTALQTLAELVIAHGVMDARTLESIVGDLIRAPMPAAAPLPPPAPSAAEAAASTKAPAATSRPLAATRPVAAPAPVVAKPAPATAKPAPVAAKPAPVVARTASATAKTLAAPVPAPVIPPKAAPVVAAPEPATVVEAPKAAAADIGSDQILLSVPVVAPVVAEPFPAAEPFRPMFAQPYVQSKPSQEVDTRRMPKVDAARLAAELTELPLPAKKPGGFFARLFGKKTSPAAVAAAAASVEFTERMPKLPYDLYGEQQKATELSFPPTEVPRKKKAAAAPRKRSLTPVRPANAGPTRFCERCWRKLDTTGSCKGCAASA